MGKEAWTCRRCGSKIRESEFRRGRAVIVLQRAYCGPCTDRVTRGGDPPRRREALEEAGSKPRI